MSQAHSADGLRLQDGQALESADAGDSDGE